MTQMSLTPLDSLLDDVWGKIGTPKRDAQEKQLHEDVKRKPQYKVATSDLGLAGKIALW